MKALDRFLGDKRYADRDEIADARNLLGQAYQLQKKFPEALAAWREYLAKHPTHHDWNQVQQAIVNTEFLLGAEKNSLKQYDEARKLWTEFLAKYPLDGRNPAIMFQFGQMNFNQEKWDDAIGDWRRLVSKYPGTNEASQGQFMIARTLETKLGKLDEAIAEYKKVNWGPAVPQANAGGETLDEQNACHRHRARVPHQRNAKDQAHQPQYRHRHRAGLHGRYGNLLPQNARSARRGRARYLADRSRQNVRVQGAEVRRVPAVGKRNRSAAADKRHAGPARNRTSGVMAVTVSGKTLEATTLVMQSDMDVILKSSRDEVFVFAENMRTGKAWPKARLLLSNGQAVFAEGATGDDGVFQKSFKELKDAGNVRVFAVADGNVASNIVDLNGVGVAQGLADQAYIYTDRPAYRPGQLVHIRGVLRKAADDGYTIEKDKKYTRRSVRRPQPRRLAERGEAFRLRQLPHQFFAAADGRAGQLPHCRARRR